VTHVALMTCVRNEGIHILEWVAYHRVIGFGQIVICSNNCDDGSDRLLDLLASHGQIDHIPNPILPGERPLQRGVDRTLAHLANSPAEWLAHLDSDEFLNVAPGAGPVADLIAKAEDAHTIALPWRNFGDNGHESWPGETLRAFTACEPVPAPETVKFKSLFRHRVFASASDHMPTAPRIETPFAVNTAGEPLSSVPLFGRPVSRYSPVEIALRGGTVINHYAIRSTDSFLLKNVRGRGMGPPSDKYFRNSNWHRRANRNDVQDRTILRRWPEIEVELARLRALPGVTAAEAGCHAWFLDARDRFLTPATLTRWCKA
jgi:Glycosyl transferase family 2